jgi:hypothetical protein
MLMTIILSVLIDNMLILFQLIFVSGVEKIKSSWTLSTLVFAKIKKTYDIYLKCVLCWVFSKISSGYHLGLRL